MVTSAAPIRYATRLVKFLKQLFDKETKQYTLAFFRDLWKFLLALIGLALMSLPLRALAIFGFSKERIETLESLHFYIIVAMVATGGVIFVVRLVVAAFFSGKNV
jgi:Na+/H+-dicarboxylate symporter